MTPEIYCNKDGYTYILAESTEISRKIQYIELLLSIAKEKIANSRRQLDPAKMKAEAVEDRQEEINDIEMAIDDLTVYAMRLRNIPKANRQSAAAA